MPTGINVIKKCRDWNSFFAETVDETLKQVFKEEGTKVIYNFLETQSRLKLEDFADKPEVFSASLERLMVSAAQVIEQTILNKLYSKAGLKFEAKKGYEFSDYITELREE